MKNREVRFIHLSLAGIAHQTKKIPSSEEYARIFAIVEADKSARVYTNLRPACPDAIEYIKRYITEEHLVEPRNVAVLLLKGEIVACFGYWVGYPTPYSDSVQCDFVVISPGINKHIRRYIEDTVKFILEDAEKENK